MSKCLIKKPKFGQMTRQLVICLALAISTANVHAGLIGVKTIEISNSINEWLQVAEFQAFNMSNVNVALSTAGATASAPDSWDGTSTPDKAIDGNTNGNFFAGSVFHEGSPRTGDTLTISLSTPTELSSITIFGRTDCCSARRLSENRKYEKHTTT